MVVGGGVLLPGGVAFPPGGGVPPGGVPPGVFPFGAHGWVGVGVWPGAQGANGAMLIWPFAAVGLQGFVGDGSSPAMHGGNCPRLTGVFELGAHGTSAVGV